MRGDELTDEQILFIVGQTDAELFNAGMDINQRIWKVPSLVMQRLGYISYGIAGPGTPPIYKRIERAFSSIYRSQDMAVGGHIGVFMYRDIFARISVPHIYGQVGINPFNFVDLTKVQLRIIQTEPKGMAIFLDQFSDVADIQYGINEIKAAFSKIELTRRFIDLSRLHLHAASAILTGGYDYRGAVQSALLACELALKSGAAAQGLSEAQIKRRFGHSLSTLAEFLTQHWPKFDKNRVLRVIERQPEYVPSRYSSTQPNRRDAGHLVMSAQYLVSEVVRQFSNRNFRECINPPQARVYPE